MSSLYLQYIADCHEDGKIEAFEQSSNYPLDAHFHMLRSFAVGL